MPSDGNSDINLRQIADQHCTTNGPQMREVAVDLKKLGLFAIWFDYLFALAVVVLLAEHWPLRIYSRHTK